MSSYQFGHAISCIDKIRALINHGQNDPTEEDDWGRSFLTGYFGMSEPYVWVLNQEEFQIDILQAGHLPFYTIVKSFASLCLYHYERTNFQSHGWELAVQRLLHLGVPLLPLIPGTITPLDVLLDNTQCAVDSSPLADAWLFLLASAGVDIEEYVAREKSLHPSGFVNPRRPEQSVRKRLIFEEGESTCQRIRWEWYYDVESPAHLALNEFSGFGYHFCDCIGYWEFNWPFVVDKGQEREAYNSKIATLKAR
jgi:hypothetical protein